ncbi:L-dopachrome tautomerase-related protein [Mucilaginibacter koreensis]
MKALFLSGLLFVTLIMSTSAQNRQSAQLIEVAEFGHYQPIGLAVTPKGRVFVTFPFREPYRYGLTELVKGKTRPYPNAEWNTHNELDAQHHLMNVQALYADRHNYLWVLDPSNPGEKETIPPGVKLLKINLATNKVERIYRFEDLPRAQIALNDVRVDNQHQMAYLSEPKTSSVVVLDLKTGKSRMVLTQSQFTKADLDFKLHLDNRDVVDKDGKPFSSNVNGIALTHDDQYFYFRAINQTKLYRIATKYLADAALNTVQLESHVEQVAAPGVSHGMIADNKGNIYQSSSPDKSIKYVTPKGEVKVLVQDDRLSWPDSFGIGSDGYLYITDSQINRTPKYNQGEDRVVYPFKLYKVKLP